MFNSLPSHPASRNTWWISLLVHGVVVTSLVLFPLVFPEQLNLLSSSDNVTLLVPPVPVTEPPKVVRLHLPVPSPTRVAAPPVRELALREELPPIVEERKESPKLALPEERPAPLPKVETALPESPPARLAATPARTVVTGVLSSPSSIAPPVNKPLREVQTGGFGDPNGVRGEGRPATMTVARLGSFDLPAGPGTGNGTGGAQGSKGVVATAGFGNGIVNSGGGTDTRRSGGNSTVQQGGFGDARPDQTTAGRPARPAGPAETPAEILFKPKPIYTDSARAARDEGEVLLRVEFAASGDIRVLDVVRGLPHGLNESALRAAEQIRFKPATRDGKPVDSVAVVHIVFQLAY